MPDYNQQPEPEREPLSNLPAVIPPKRAKKLRADSLAALSEMGLPNPVEFMVNLYCDVNIPRVERMDAAKAAAPYLHHKLSAVDVTTTVNTSHEDALDALEAEYSDMSKTP